MQAIQELNGYMLNNTRIVVEEARPKDAEDRILCHISNTNIDNRNLGG